MAKRRRSGEGSIFRLKNGSWCGFANLGYRNGKRCRKKIIRKSEQEVIAEVAELAKKVRDGEAINTNRTFVRDYLRSWLQDTVRNSVRANTYKSYADQLERYLIPRLGHLELTKLKPQHIRRCLNDLRHSGGVERGPHATEKRPRALSPRTVQYCRRILSEALSQAVDDELIRQNPVTPVKGPTVEVHEIDPYTPAQARALLTAVRGDRLEALFTVAVALGLRQGEILGLRWKDLDLEKSRLSVRHQLQRIDGEPKFVPPKSKKSRRTIIMPAVVLTALIQHRERQCEYRALAGTRWQEWDLVFPTMIGTPMESSNLNHYFQKVAAAAGLPRRRFHDLRHTAATLLLIQGVHPRLAMGILGHSQITLTMNTYSHYLPEEMGHEAASQMDEILSERVVEEPYQHLPQEALGYPLATRPSLGPVN